MLAAILPILSDLVGKVASNFFPNPQDELKKIELQTQIQAEILKNAGFIEKAASEVVLAEAKGESVLQRNWRPTTMLVFVGLIVSRWLGFSAQNLSEAEYLKLWEIIQFGLSGYVLTRSCEKIVPSVAQVFKNSK